MRVSSQVQATAGAIPEFPRPEPLALGAIGPPTLARAFKLRWPLMTIVRNRSRGAQRLGRRQRARRHRLGEKIDGARTALGGVQSVHPDAGGSGTRKRKMTRRSARIGEPRDACTRGLAPRTTTARVARAIFSHEYKLQKNKLQSAPAYWMISI